MPKLCSVLFVFSFTGEWVLGIARFVGQSINRSGRRPVNFCFC